MIVHPHVLEQKEECHRYGRLTVGEFDCSLV